MSITAGAVIVAGAILINGKISHTKNFDDAPSVPYENYHPPATYGEERVTSVDELRENVFKETEKIEREHPLYVTNSGGSESRYGRSMAWHFLDEMCCELPISLYKYNVATAVYDVVIADFRVLQNYEYHNFHIPSKAPPFIAGWSEDGRYIIIMASPYESYTASHVVYLDMLNLDRGFQEIQTGVYSAFGVNENATKAVGFDVKEDTFLLDYAPVVEHVYVLDFNSLEVEEVLSIEWQSESIMGFGGMGEYAPLINWLDEDTLEIKTYALKDMQACMSQNSDTNPDTCQWDRLDFLEENDYLFDKIKRIVIDI